MSLLDEARKPQERKEADVVFGTAADVAKETGYEAECTGIYRKESDYPNPHTGEKVFNIYITGTMDDGRTLLVLGQTVVIRDEIEKAIAAGFGVGKRFAVLHEGYRPPKIKGRKPARLDRFVGECGPTKATESAQAESTDATPEDVPF